jgi:hypothetical protein
VAVWIRTTSAISAPGSLSDARKRVSLLSRLGLCCLGGRLRCCDGSVWTSLTLVLLLAGGAPVACEQYPGQWTPTIGVSETNLVSCDPRWREPRGGPSVVVVNPGADVTGVADVTGSIVAPASQPRRPGCRVEQYISSTARPCASIGAVADCRGDRTLCLPDSVRARPELSRAEAYRTRGESRRPAQLAKRAPDGRGRSRR